MATNYKFSLKDEEKFDLVVKLGSYGSIKLIFKWNKLAGVYSIGGEDLDGNPLFYGQTLIPAFDLFKNFRNLSLPLGRLGIIRTANVSDGNTYPTPETITDFTLIYSE